FPQFNASLAANGNDLVYKKYFHLGIAVDTSNGLVVPVVRDIDSKGLFEIAKELGEISAKAREGKLKPTEMTGSSMSISSLGGIGGTAFTPIINAPDVAILGVSKAQIKPVYMKDAFVPRKMLPLSLSYDHRVIDGAEAARFLVHVVEQLQDIRKLLL
ncbi:MAG TPA: 2-oxo acid dehydrogenase subunit E2, partial [Candidatus Berkiella sp.]|nr:2-oxo acid dehydrogenase subunit E2 [Candidatus Berkiella sp.]